jgi:hypothetical protein
VLFFSPIRVTFPVLLIFHANYIWWKEHNMKSISKKFSPVSSNCAPWCPNIFLSNTFSANVLPRNITDQVLLHPYTIAGKINILYILHFNFLDSKLEDKNSGSKVSGHCLNLIYF